MPESQPENKNPTVNWNELYEKGTTPWDMGDVTPAISDLLTRPNLPHRPLDLASIHRVLIPGCGNAHDANAWANKVDHVMAVDISPLAIAGAEKNRRQAGIPESKLSLVVGDFFTMKKKSPLFDLIFDYTFLCAIDINMRHSWASQMNALLNPNGYLLTLMFPLGRINNVQGIPPFPLSVEIYHELLDSYFDLVWAVDCPSTPARSPLEKLALWKKKS